MTKAFKGVLWLVNDEGIQRKTFYNHEEFDEALELENYFVSREDAMFFLINLLQKKLKNLEDRYL